MEFYKPYKVIKKSKSKFWGTIFSIDRHYEIYFENSSINSYLSNFTDQQDADIICAALNGAYNLGYLQSSSDFKYQN